MDVSDIFLAVCYIYSLDSYDADGDFRKLAKCINYVSETASVPVFAFFVCVWT